MSANTDNSATTGPTDAVMERRIAHLDMDAFYASMELLRYPQLRGLSVVIGGKLAHDVGEERQDLYRLRQYTGRGVVTTATYEARAFGIRSGMALMKAATLAPEAILLPADFDEYRRYSRLFKAAAADIAPQIEDRGIDEIYIDLTDVPGETVELAQRIKDNVRRTTGLSCSIGVTPNKLLSKIASELQKPDGLTVLSQTDLPTRIWPLPARTINGIGPRASAKLEALGIHTVGDPPPLPSPYSGCRARPRRAPGRHGADTEVDEPRDDLRVRPTSTTRPANPLPGPAGTLSAGERRSRTPALPRQDGRHQTQV